MNHFKRVVCTLIVLMFVLYPIGLDINYIEAEPMTYKIGDLYVSNTGKPNAAGTKEDPLDLVTALNLVKPGQTIWMTQGVYSFSSTISIKDSNSGTEDNYKGLSSINGGKVILDFSSMTESSSNRGVSLGGRYWHIYGIDITKAGDNGMILCGSDNIVEMCKFYSNRDTGLQVSQSNSVWPANNYILNCTSYNNKDADGEDADGFAAKLTCGEGNVFDGCLSYNNSDDGWDLYAKTSTGPIGVVTIRNCIAFRNGKLTDGQGSASGDMNGFKLGGSGIGTPHIIENCIAFENGASGFTDNNNPSAIILKGCTSFNNSVYTSGSKPNFRLDREAGGINSNLLSFTTRKTGDDAFIGTIENSIYYSKKPAYYYVKDKTNINGKEALGVTTVVTSADFVNIEAPDTDTDFHTAWRNTDGSINTHGFLEIKETSTLSKIASDGGAIGARINNAPDVEETKEPETTPAFSEIPDITASPVPAEEITGLGDIDGNERINTFDALIVLRHVAKLSVLNDKECLVADVSGDKNVNVADAILILQYAARIIDSF